MLLAESTVLAHAGHFPLPLLWSQFGEEDGTVVGKYLR